MSQPFDDAKFNFCKALQKEVLFQLEPAGGGGAGAEAAFSPAAPAPASPHLVLINVSPIEYGHVLLVGGRAGLLLCCWLPGRYILLC